MDHTSTNNQEQEPNLNRESTIQKMTKLIQLNAETLFSDKGREDSYAYTNAESVAAKLYDEHIVPSGNFTTNNIINVMSTVNLRESEFTAKEAEIDVNFQKEVEAAKLLCEAKKLKVNTESALYRTSPDVATNAHIANCDMDYEYLISRLEANKSRAKCMLSFGKEYAIELCEVDLFVRPRDYVEYWDSLMSLNLSSNTIKFIDDIVNMHFEERRNKTIKEHYSCLATLDDYVSVHEILSKRIPVDCLENHPTM